MTATRDRDARLPDFLRELERELPLTLSKREAANVLRMSVITIDRAIASRELRVVKSGHARSARVIIPRCELLRWMAVRAV